ERAAAAAFSLRPSCSRGEGLTKSLLGQVQPGAHDLEVLIGLRHAFCSRGPVSVELSPSLREMYFRWEAPRVVRLIAEGAYLWIIRHAECRDTVGRCADQAMQPVADDQARAAD